MLSLLNPRGWFSSGSTALGLRRRRGKQQIGPISSVGDTAGVPVNFETAMQLSSFWASVKLWAEVVAGLPFCVERRADDGQWLRDDEHWLYSLFYDRQPNRYQNRIEFFESMTLNQVVFGNAYALIKRDSTGRVVSLLPINSGDVTTELLSDGSVVHHYYNDGAVTVLADESVWHWKQVGNTIVGLSTIDYAKNSIGAGLAADKRASRLMRSAGKPPGFFTLDSTLKPEQRELLRKHFERLQMQEKEMAGVLEAGMDFKRVGLSSADLQLLESRRFQVEDVARFVDVPSVLINDTTNSTSWGTGISEIIRGWYKKSVRHKVNSLQESMRFQLIQSGERPRLRIVHDFNDLLKMDRAERVRADQTSVNMGSMTFNEARAADGRQPSNDPAADTLHVNSALVPIDKLGQSRPANARVEMIEAEEES